MVNFALMGEWHNWVFVLFVAILLCLFSNIFSDFVTEE